MAYRLGVYPAKLGAGRDQWARGEVSPEWCADPLTRVRAVSSAVLDVEPPAGSTVAVVSQDGVPSAPMYIGTIFDGAFTLTDQTAWVRAHLNAHPGQLELGATVGLRLRVGSKPNDLEPLPPGRLSMGNGTAEVVRELTDLTGEVRTLLSTINTCLLAIATASTALESGGGTPGVVVTFSAALKGAIATTTPQLAATSARLTALDVKLQTLKE